MSARLDCDCEKLHAVTRAVKAMALAAGPLALRPRNWSVARRTVAEYRAESPVQHGRALDRRWDRTEWMAEIQGIGSVVSNDPDTMLDDLGKKAKEALS